jgi:hypothetical protein
VAVKKPEKLETEKLDKVPLKHEKHEKHEPKELKEHFPEKAAIKSEKELQPEKVQKDKDALEKAAPDTGPLGQPPGAMTSAPPPAGPGATLEERVAALESQVAQL